jgi:hypothetical protein
VRLPQWPLPQPPLLVLVQPFPASLSQPLLEQERDAMPDSRSPPLLLQPRTRLRLHLRRAPAGEPRASFLAKPLLALEQPLSATLFRPADLLPRRPLLEAGRPPQVSAYHSVLVPLLDVVRPLTAWLFRSALVGLLPMRSPLQRAATPPVRTSR